MNLKLYVVVVWKDIEATSYPQQSILVPFINIIAGKSLVRAKRKRFNAFIFWKFNVD